MYVSTNNNTCRQAGRQTDQRPQTGKDYVGKSRQRGVSAHQSSIQQRVSAESADGWPGCANRNLCDERRANDGAACRARAAGGKTGILGRVAARRAIQRALVRRRRSAIRSLRVPGAAGRPNDAHRAGRCQHHLAIAPPCPRRQGRRLGRCHFRRPTHFGRGVGRPSAGISRAQRAVRRPQRTLSRKLRLHSADGRIQSSV